VRVGVAQGSGCCLCVWALVAISSKRYSQGKFQTDVHGEPGIMSASGPWHCQENVGQNLCLRAAGASGKSAPGKKYPYPHLFLDSIALTPLVSIGFGTQPFPNHHTCVRIRPILHSKSAGLQAAVLPPSVQTGLYSSREHLVLRGQQDRQKPLCCCVNVRHLKWPRVFGQISIPERLYIVHKTPVSGKYVYDCGPNKTCLDNNLLLFHFLWLCIGDSLR
jgi:hypothetical protein